MYNSIRQLFREEAAHLKIDSDLAKRIRRFLTRFVNHDDDTLTFLGSPLVGVYPIRFTMEFTNEWWDEVLEVDDLTIQSQIKEHFATAPDLDPKWKVSSNALNLSFVWLTHEFFHSDKIGKREKEKVMMDLITLLQYKFISSLEAHFFKYPCDKGTAQAVYSSLSKKFLLKQHSSWAEVVKYRSDDILSGGSIHVNAIRKMDTDIDVVKMLNDVQGRYREIYKRVATLFHQFREQDAKIHSISNNIDLSGEIAVRDTKNNFSGYRQAAHEIASNPKSLLKRPLLEVTYKIVHTAPAERVDETLEWLSKNYGGRRVGYIEEFVETTIVHAMGYIQSENLSLNDFATILVRLRGVYLASRQSDPQILKIRELGEKITKNAINSTNQAVHASVRTALALYIVLRVLAKDKY